MTNPDFLSVIFDLRFLGKLFLLVLSFFYFVLSVVIFRQTTLMTQTLHSQVSPIIKLLAVIQIVSVGMLFILVAVIT